VIGWQFTYSETFATWVEFFEQIRQIPAGIVGDGQKGMFKAICYRFPRVPFQRCQFHVIAFVNRKLTRHPETIAAIEFKQIVRVITTIKTQQQHSLWLAGFHRWCFLYQGTLKQKTYQDARTPSGRYKWHYTHARLHAAYSHVKNALPYLFTYLQYPKLPNTTNDVEGGINSQIQRLICQHRGARLETQRQIIAAFLRSRQRQKPTRNCT
jgi:hypothetical protein